MVLQIEDKNKLYQKFFSFFPKIYKQKKVFYSMFVNKKGGLEIRYVVLLALALVVLVVIILLFTGGIAEFGGKFRSIFADIWKMKPDLK